MFIIKGSFQDKKQKGHDQLVRFASLGFVSWRNVPYQSFKPPLSLLAMKYTISIFLLIIMIHVKPLTTQLFVQTILGYEYSWAWLKLHYIVLCNVVSCGMTSTRHCCKCVHMRQLRRIQDCCSMQNWVMLTLMGQQPSDQATREILKLVLLHVSPSLENHQMFL